MFGRRLAQTILLASSIAAGFEFPGFGCHLVIEKNEWAAGCVPAVNFVVKLSNCDDGTAMSDVTILFLDESNHELGRDYFAAPTGQCSVSGYGNVRTITPRGGNHVFMIASADLCGKQTTSISSNQVPINGQVSECY
ncbi:hypothetical protein THAOC_05946 [Thalassiosira oceanica]|uniref:Uncharacterized protein n=1 Tax=Thalassiosira oceanica TaxID=159749 RepID=K0T1J6_THAOC|nr:hypothetical protein THAOC_05946 [Thalassiosira oceanica]|eukprot:EJK72518.1 hypothetical protein THAOC_05946 [Thalassiosira oceanica]